eukprot:g2309.t1
MKCRLILCILIVLSIQLVLSHAVKKSTHKMKTYMERVARKRCGPKCRQKRRNRRARRNQARRKQEDLDNRILPNVKTDKCGLHGNACYQVNNKKCGTIVWDVPFYKEECDEIGNGRYEYSKKVACERRVSRSSDYINIDMLKVNKEGTIYEYDCEDRKFRNTGLCKDMMKRSSTCKCKSGIQKYEIFGGGGSTTRKMKYGVTHTTKYQSILRLHVECKNNKMSWRVTADRCDIKYNDINCEENDDHHRRRRRRRRLLYRGGSAC